MMPDERDRELLDEEDEDEDRPGLDLGRIMGVDAVRISSTSSSESESVSSNDWSGDGS